MKKIVAIFTMLITMTVSANAMSYAQARDQALFLTDKMAYELNLSEEQYDAAYEINLDYLMSINSYDDLYGSYWTSRNLDLSYILLDWQYRAFCAATYFYRPLYFTSGVWHFAIYSHYPRRDFYYFGRPQIFDTYRGGHSWVMNGGQSWYKGRTFNHSGVSNGNGMRDRFNRGDFNNGNRGNGNFGGNRNFSGNRGNGNNIKNAPTIQNNNGVNRPSMNFNGARGPQRMNRESSTRKTVKINEGTGVTPSFGGNKTPSTKQSTGSSIQKAPSGTFTPKSSGSTKSSSSFGSSGKSVPGTKISGESKSSGGQFGGKR